MQTTHRSLKEKQREEREQLILQMAEEVLLEKGYYETSMDEIATRVGIAKGTLYLHFPSKEDLVMGIFARDMQTFLESVDSITATQTSNRAKLEALLHFMYTGFFSKRAQLLSSIYNSRDLQRIFLEKGGCMLEMWEKLATHITALLDAGKASGEFTTNIPTPVLLSAFLSLLSPKSYKHLIFREQMDTEDLVRYMSQIYFHGVITE